MNNPIPPTFLDPHERALMVKLTDTIEHLAKCMEERLPPTIGSQHWQQNFHSPNPWADLYWKYQSPDQDHLTVLTKLEFEALSFRATLAAISMELRSAFHQSGEVVKSAPDLSLAKKKRVEA